MTRTRPFVALAAALASLSVSAIEVRAGDDPAAVEFFESKVRPLLVNRCQSCHGGGKAKGGLRLDSRATAMTGGDTGPAIVPGKPDESLIVEAIKYGDDLQMPPKSKLPAEEIAVLTRWVEQGAPWPVGVEASRLGTGQAVQPPRASGPLEPPAGHRTRPRPRSRIKPGRSTPIDRFLLAKLEAKGLKPAAEADRRTLIRRLTFDLIGLPPKPEEVEAFVADSSPDAYEKLVDRLLGLAPLRRALGTALARPGPVRGDLGARVRLRDPARLSLSRLRDPGLQRRRALQPVRRRAPRGRPPARASPRPGHRHQRVGPGHRLLPAPRGGPLAG